MSGGSYDYFYSKVNDVADQLMVQTNPLRRAFALHLKKVATAMHDIEWVDSGDSSEGDEEKAINAVLGSTSKECQLKEVLHDLRRTAEQIQKLCE